MKEHSEDKHDISLDQQAFEDPDEEEPFVWFFKSMKIDSDYIKHRKQFYPQHWNHIEERVKIRLIAQLKLKNCSEEIKLFSEVIFFRNEL